MGVSSRRLAALALVGVAVAVVMALASRGVFGAAYPNTAVANATHRNWRTDVLDSVPIRIPADGDRLLNPVDVVEASNGNVYVLDFGDRSVKQFTPEGAFVRRYGKGRGRGPGELLNPSDVQITAVGEVWILDPAQGRIQIFDAGGEPVRTLPVNVPANRMILNPDGSYLLLGKADWLLYHFSSTGELLKHFGRLMRAQERYSIALQGEIAPLADGGVLYGPMRGGYLARFSPGGDLAYYRQTVDPKPFPKVKFFSDGGSTINRESRNALSTVGLSVQGTEAWILTNAQVGGRTRGTIDVYNLVDGAYSYSLISPQRAAANLFVTPAHVYIVGDTVVTRWTRRRGDTTPVATVQSRR